MADAAAFLAGLRVGDLLDGTVAGIGRRSGVSVLLDGFDAKPLGLVGELDLSWRSSRAEVERTLEVGGRVRAGVLRVDADAGVVWLSMAASEDPELWRYLCGLRSGQVVSGVVASIESFGVFVELDDGPSHPVYPGVGFITFPELAWRRFEDPSEVVAVGERVRCGVLMFDTTNGEARLSLCALTPDPLKEFMKRVRVGQAVSGAVTLRVPFGVFVRVADGVEGLIHESEIADEPADVFAVGREVDVIVTSVDPRTRRVRLCPVLGR